ncbi:MAG: hypothetical protein OQK73_11015 [Gammaproteobacteria bacterium]|nr:hypothetical protein [Gammaproteobacteria bacterium]
MLKNIIILLLISSLSIGGYVANKTIDGLKTAMVALQLKHKKQIVKTKVKERGKRVLALLPVVGIAAVAWFEKKEYDEWKTDNPDGTPEQYTDEMTEVIKEISLSYYEELKEEMPDIHSPQGNHILSP